MRRSKFGNGVTIQDHANLYGGDKPVRRGKGGRRESTVLSSVDLREYAEMPEIDTRTETSFRSIPRSDDRTKNDDRVVSDHLDPTSRQTINHLRETIVTGETIQAPPPSKAPDFKLRSRNARTRNPVQLPHQDDLEVSAHSTTVRNRDPRKVTGIKHIPDQQEGPTIDVRPDRTVQSKRDSHVDPNFVSSEQINIDGDTRPQQTLREKQQGFRPGPTSSGFDSSIFVALRIPKLEKISVKASRTRPTTTENLPDIDTNSRRHSTHKEKKAVTKIPTYDRDREEVGVTNKGVSKGSRKRKISSKIRSEKTIDDIRVAGGFTKAAKDFGKQKPTREFSLSKDEAEIAVQPREKSRSKKRETVSAQGAADIDRKELTSSHQSSETKKRSNLVGSQSDVDREEVTTRSSGRIKEKKTIQAESQADVDREEVTNRTEVRVKEKQKKSHNSGHVTDQDEIPSVASKPTSRGKGKKKAVGSRKVHVAETDRPQISYVKYDPSSKIMEDKIKQTAPQSEAGRKEESIEVRMTPKSSERQKVVPIPHIVEGEDDSFSEPVLQDPMQSRKRQEIVPREVSAGVDSSDRIENPKIKIVFD